MKPRWFDVLPAAVLLAGLMFPLRGGFTDDGFIHVQYARNLATRGEYSFNPGETSFGTTSPLWVMALAAVSLPVDDPEFLVDASRAFSWAAAFAALVVVHRLLVALGASRRFAALGAVAFAADVWLVRWSALGMESSAAAWTAALLLLASTRAYDGRADAARFGAAAAIAALVRPEAYLALPVFVLGALTLSPKPRRGVLLAGLAVGAALLVPWLLFAKWHIGSFLPNTAGAKSGGMVVNPVVFAAKLAPVIKIMAAAQAVSVLAIVADVAVRRREAFVFTRAFRFAALWMLALPLAYVAADIQILSRYLLLITPAVCAGGWRSAEGLAARLPARARVPAAAAALVVAVGINAGVYAKVVLPPSRAFSEDLLVRMTGLAKFLRANSAPDAVVAAADIGYLAFHSQRRVLDLGGLVEPETGRLRAAHDYEDLVARGLYFGLPGYPHVDYLVDRELVADRFDGRVVNGHRFERIYLTEVRNLGIRKPGTWYYTLYRITPVEAAP